jgi:hypothetical protein
MCDFIDIDVTYLRDELRLHWGFDIAGRKEGEVG